jgi:xylan 1,4-beta-xylosidase
MKRAVRTKQDRGSTGEKVQASTGQVALSGQGLHLLLLFFLAVNFFMCSVCSVAAAGSYENPVLTETFRSAEMGTVGIGDPDVIYHDGTYYLYPTGDNRGYDVYLSRDLVHWKKGARVFRSGQPHVWAPDVVFNPSDGRFYLYYTADRKIGVAVSDRPDAAFTDLGILIKNAIDADMFLDDDGKYYLYYAKWQDSGIFVQPMESPLRKKGRPVELIRPTEPWEINHRPTTEAPFMLKHGDTYYLLYSGGSPDSADYAIGYATARDSLGPFSKYRGNPIMKRHNGVYGPGHCAVIATPDGKLWMVYHQKTNASKGWDRIISIDRIWFDEKGVLHGEATRGTPQAAPGK